jgi:ribosomal protein L34
LRQFAIGEGAAVIRHQRQTIAMLGQSIPRHRSAPSLPATWGFRQKSPARGGGLRSAEKRRRAKGRHQLAPASTQRPLPPRACLHISVSQPEFVNLAAAPPEVVHSGPALRSAAPCAKAAFPSARPFSREPAWPISIVS